MLITTIVLGWLVIMVGMCVLWSRFHQNIRAVEGIDETEYSDGLDEASLREAA